MGKFVDLTGQTFGRLTVTKYVGVGSSHRTLWECQCECGKSTIVESYSLRRGATKSCGCLLQEYLHSPKKGGATHGKTNTRLYHVWRGMKQRCLDPNHKNYHRYGGRGITICDEWMDDFPAFEKWAIDNGYDAMAPRGHCTLDRIDNDGNYEPDNCRWATAQVQYYNRDRGNPLTDIARAHDLTYDAVHQRMKKGQTLEEALQKPLRRTVRIVVDGVEKTIKQLAKETGIPESTLYYRERQGLRGQDLFEGGRSWSA